MSNRLYVGNLPYQISNEDLQSKFAEFGTVKSCKVITDFETGRSKGFGFVEMETAEEAQSCIDGLDGQDFNGRGLRVSIARERENKGGGGGRRF